MHRASSYYLLIAFLLISTMPLEAKPALSSNAGPTGLAYYIAVVKKRFQGKPLTRKETETFSSLKKGLLVTLAVTGTLGATGLYRLYSGQSKINESPPPPKPDPAPVLSDADESGQSAGEESSFAEAPADREEEDSSEDEFAYDDEGPDMFRNPNMLRNARQKGRGSTRAATGSEDEEEDAENWEADGRVPSPEEEQQPRNSAPGSLGSYDESFPRTYPEYTDLQDRETVAAALRQRRKRVSHKTLHDQRRAKQRARLAENSFTPEAQDTPEDHLPLFYLAITSDTSLP